MKPQKHFMRIICITLIIFGLSWHSPTVNTFATDTEDTLAYKLASMHTRALSPENSFLKLSADPDDSVVYEFQWLIDSIKRKSSNSESSIGETIVAAWKLLKSRGQKMSLLEVTRALTKNLENKSRYYRNRKVDFSTLSGSWTSQYRIK